MTDTPRTTDQPQDGTDSARALAELRAEIDRIDEAMHRLLMERGEIIDRLVKVKRAKVEGSAFRPAREAAMMKRLVDRHDGLLPLDTVESIWRVIISTFTYVQAPYQVHADLSCGDAAMRDSARFHFGFTAPFVPHLGPLGVIEGVRASRGDLGLLPANVHPGGHGGWWTALEAEGAPKIIARLPFVERADHPAGLPVFVVSRPIDDAAVKDVSVYSLRAEQWSPRAAAAMPAFAEWVLAENGAPGTVALLVSLPPGHGIDEILAPLKMAGAEVKAAIAVGSHAAPYRPARASAVS